MKGPILGWDVGGTNLKVARITQSRQPEPEVTPRIRPRPAALMIGSADRSTLR